VQAAQPVLDIALEHLVVAGLVHHLGGLEELGIRAGHGVHQLAAGEHGALLSVHQHGESPGGDAAVQLHPVLLGEALPQRAPVDVHQLVGEDAALGRLGGGPGDVAGGVPLIALGLLVEAAHVLGLDGVVELEDRVVRAGNDAALTGNGRRRSVHRWNFRLWS
jgi:hypothetical protein